MCFFFFKIFFFKIIDQRQNYASKSIDQCRKETCPLRANVVHPTFSTSLWRHIYKFFVNCQLSFIVYFVFYFIICYKNVMKRNHLLSLLPSNDCAKTVSKQSQNSNKWYKYDQFQMDAEITVWTGNLPSRSR